MNPITLVGTAAKLLFGAILKDFRKDLRKRGLVVGANRKRVLKRWIKTDEERKAELEAQLEAIRKRSEGGTDDNQDKVELN